MNYKAEFSYLVNQGNWQIESPDDIPVSSFFVIGGSTRVIGLRSTGDNTLSAEFEQARIYKNLQLDISSPKNAVSVTADLMEMAFKKAAFNLTFVVQAYSGRIKVSSLLLFCHNATLKQNPIPQPGNSLALDISIPDVSLYHGGLNNRRKFVIEEV